MFLVDTSTSMKDHFNGKSRIQWAMESIHDLMGVFHSSCNVSLVEFSDSVNVLNDLIPVSEMIKESLDIPNANGLTYTDMGLEKALAMLEGSDHGVVILLTDGEHNGNNDPKEIAASSSVPIYTLSIGDQDKVNSESLDSIAQISGGAYTHVSEIDTLKTKMQELLLN